MKTTSFLLSALVLHAAAGTQAPPNLGGIGIQQRLGARLPLDAAFTNGDGERLPLRAYFSRRPVVLALVYYTCPMLCSQILSGVVAGLRPLSLQPGRDFDVVAISINPQETPRDAVKARDLYSHKYSREGGPAGWHFLVGSADAIQSVTEAAGFHYRYDPESKMFFHASGIMVVTPDGRLARYLYGVSFQPKDLKLALVEASGNRIGTAADQVLLYCYHYDPKVGKYGLAVFNLLRATGALFFVGGVIVLTVMFRRDVRRDRHPAGEARIP
ncbi:MAG TPA: SCO family protein [Bryobacteraceae bacterium]|nr:SCO family protein [Bryobacteraceae bacterium]